MTTYDEYRTDKIVFYLEGIRNGTRRFPPSLQIAITDHCFNKCVMCGHWQRSDKKEIGWQQLLSFLSEAKGIGLETVCYSGGDPFRYVHLNKIMEWHIENDMPFGFIACGYLPHYINVDLLRHAAWVRVSIDSIVDDRYAKLRGGIGLAQVRKSLDVMWQAGVNLQFGITLTGDNCTELMDLAHYAISLHASSFRVWPVRSHPELSCPTDKAKHYLLRTSAILEGIDNNCIDAIDILENGEHMDFKECKAVLFQLFIDASGRVYHCCILAGDACEHDLADSLGSIFTDPLPSIYAEALAFSKIPRNRLPDGCSGCTKRLQTISVVAEKHWNDKHFV
jgi:MoaA/NifB/PqqE/SkfB family radical SAM enzyme